MKREEQIAKTWELCGRNKFLYLQASGMFQARLFDNDPLPLSPSYDLVAGVEEVVTFTVEHLFWCEEGEPYDWANVLCEGRVVDWKWL